MDIQEYSAITQSYLSESFDKFVNKRIVNKALKDELYLEKDKVVNRWVKISLNEEKYVKRYANEETVRQVLWDKVWSRFIGAVVRLSNKLLDENSTVIEADNAIDVLDSRIDQIFSSTLICLSAGYRDRMRYFFDLNIPRRQIVREFFANTEAPYTVEKAENYPLADELLDRMEEVYSKHIDDAIYTLRHEASDVAHHFDLPSNWREVLKSYQPLTLYDFLDSYEQIANYLPEFIDELQR